VRAWVVHQPGPVASGPLRLTERPVPEPGPGELLIKVHCCGVCRTDLHLAEGDLPPRRPDVTPGHEVVGEVAAAGPGTTRFVAGDRVGVAWLYLVTSAFTLAKMLRDRHEADLLDGQDARG